MPGSKDASSRWLQSKGGDVCGAGLRFGRSRWSGLWALVLAMSACAGGPLRAVPEYVLLHHDIGVGSQVTLCGELLDDPLPPPSLVTPMDRLFDDEEDGEGLILVENGDGGGVLRFPVSTEDGRFCVQETLTRPLEPGTYPVLWQATRGRQGFSPARLRVLPLDYRGRVVISDIDLTYLQTDFETAASMARLLRETAGDKRPFVGMPEVYRGLTGKDGTPLIFMSGSPGFFRPTLEARLSMDGIRHDALLLKPFGAIVKRRLKRGSVRGVVSALKEQVAYKLERLIALDRRLPQRAGYVLLGDNSESDFVVYAVFRDLLHGRLAPEVLGERLAVRGVDQADVARIVSAAAEMVSRKASLAVPVDIFIRRVSLDGPSGMDPGIRWHFDSYQLALGLFELSLISGEDVRRVADALGTGWTGDQARARSARWALEHGLISRERLYRVVTETELGAIDACQDWDTWFDAPSGLSESGEPH